MPIYRLQIRDEAALSRWARRHGFLYVHGIDPVAYVVAAASEADAREIAKHASDAPWWLMAELSDCDRLDHRQQNGEILLTAYSSWS
jgi:hypothetical protein